MSDIKEKKDNEKEIKRRMSSDLNKINKLLETIIDELEDTNISLGRQMIKTSDLKKDGLYHNFMTGIDLTHKLYDKIMSEIKNINTSLEKIKQS